MHHVGDTFAFDFGLGANDEAVAEDAEGDGVDVGVGEVMAAIQESAGPGAAQQALNKSLARRLRLVSA